MTADLSHARQAANAGWAFLRAGNPAHAIREFRSALSIDPTDATALSGLCQGYLNLDQLDDADRESLALVQLAPELAAAHRVRAELLRRKRAPFAREHAQKAVELDPDEPVGFHILALVHQDAHRRSEALAVIEEGRKLAPWYGVLAAQKAQILLEWKGPRAAMPVAEEALRLGLDQSFVARVCARIFLMAGETERARDLLEVVLQRDANDEEAISLYLLTDPKRYGLLRAFIRFPYWRRDHGALGWVAWALLWGSLIVVSLTIIVGAHVPGIVLVFIYRGFWEFQYRGHRKAVKDHFAKPKLRPGF